MQDAEKGPEGFRCVICLGDISDCASIPSCAHQYWCVALTLMIIFEVIHV